MYKHWILLLVAVPLLAVAEDESIEVVEYTRGDTLIVEDVEGDEDGTTRSPVRQTDKPLPKRGMNMDNVRNVFGEPAREHDAVGDPPITRWDYDYYSVFFEHDKVLHSVVTE